MINGIQKEKYEILTLENYKNNFEFYKLVMATHQLKQLKNNSLICINEGIPTEKGNVLTFRVVKSQSEFIKELIALTDFLTTTSDKRKQETTYLIKLVKD